MNAIIKNAVENFIKNNSGKIKTGKYTTLSEIEKYEVYLGKIVPRWYKELLILFPISELIIGIPNDFGQEEFIWKKLEELPKLCITFNSYPEIYKETFDYFPGCELRNANYLCIAKDNDTTQEGIYIDITNEDPSIQIVFHDIGETTNELIMHSETLLEKFSDIFSIGILGD